MRPTDALFAAFDRDGVPVGVAHAAVYEGTEGDECEIGISVLADHRGRGIGRRLMARTVVWARNAGIRLMRTLCLTSNREMAALASSFGAQLRRGEDGTEGEIALAPADVASRMTEITEESLARLEEMIDAGTRLASVWMRFWTRDLPVMALGGG